MPNTKDSIPIIPIRKICQIIPNFRNWLHLRIQLSEMIFVNISKYQILNDSFQHVEVDRGMASLILNPWTIRHLVTLLVSWDNAFLSSWAGHLNGLLRHSCWSQSRSSDMSPHWSVPSQIMVEWVQLPLSHCSSPGLQWNSGHDSGSSSPSPQSSWPSHLQQNGIHLSLWLQRNWLLSQLD